MATVNDMMLNLKEMFGDHNLAGRQVAMKILLNMKMAEGTPVRDHVLKMIARLNELEILGVKIDGGTRSILCSCLCPSPSRIFALITL